MVSGETVADPSEVGASPVSACLRLLVPFSIAFRQSGVAPSAIRRIKIP